MGTARRQYTDDFKREAVGLLASSGRPLSQIAEELGIASSRLRAWRNKGDGRYAGSPRRRNTQAVILHAGADLAAENARDSRHDLPVAPNRLDQKFAAERPNQVWLADISYVPTSEGWLYLAVVLDLFTRKIVGWAMRDHMRMELTIAALTMAIQRQKPPPGLIHHSDRGSQYAAADYRKLLGAAGMIQSMSRKGNCWLHRWKVASAL
jgi:transposase InsO family protein